MKFKKIFALLLLLSLCLSSTACGERYAPLHTYEADGLTYTVRGNNGRPRQIVVKLGETVVWQQAVNVNRKVGNYKNCYGFEIMDLNFDGTKDVVLTVKLDGDVADVRCWLWNSEKNTFRFSEELSSLNNVMADKNMKAIFAFEHEYVFREATKDLPDTYVSTDKVTKYVWANGALIPERRVSLSYESEHKFYVYSIENYNEDTAAYDEPKETYLSEEEYRNTDFSFFYYFK